MGTFVDAASYLSLRRSAARSSGHGWHAACAICTWRYSLTVHQENTFLAHFILSSKHWFFICLEGPLYGAVDAAFNHVGRGKLDGG